ncbi:MAG: 2-phospho-L-lactate guanylyltransferase [Sporichthyaceae bacterium]
MTAPLENFSAADWCLVVPVKRLESAKSRLAGSAAAHRERLALAFAGDTVAAAIACPIVATVLVVTDDPRAREMALALGAEVVPDSPDAGLNPALRWGAEIARDRRPSFSIGALSADLPALRPAELECALRFAATAGRAGHPAVVADSHGRGTTAYLTANGVAFDPAFGADSLAVHLGAGARAVPGDDIATLRLDVDTVEDLAVAAGLGVGERTAAVLADVLLP